MSVDRRFQFADALRDLERRQPERIVPDLSRIEAVVGLLDHPERTYPTVHVAGTNGKTTTARLVTSILCAHGLAAGTYTSPHLHSVTERIALCGEPIPEEEFAEEYVRLSPYLEEVDRRGGTPVTYFEVLTALSFLWFADKPVDVGVFEVGMGGRWDATNVVRGEVAVLCPVGLDHPELGSTVAEVAAEKAAIVKEGARVVVREQRPEGLTVIEAKVDETGATMLLEGREFAVTDRSPAVGGQTLDVRTPTGQHSDLFLPLFGAHQASNAAAAVAAAEALLGRPLGEEPLREGLASVRSPGRMEILAHRPTVLADGAHNPDAARALAAALPEAFTWRRLFLVLGVLADKDVDEILDALAPLAASAAVAAPPSPRALPAADLAAAAARHGLPATVHDSIPEAVDAARALAREDDLVLVTGSLYTVANARAHLSKS